VSRFVIDAVTLVSVLETERRFDSLHQLVSPGSVRSQALDLLLGRVAEGDLAEREALRVHERLTETRIRLLNDRVSRRAAWDLARSRGWPTLRDAEYLALVKLQADALVTIDERLAALAEGIVAVRPLDEVLVAAAPAL